ncbi:MAG: glycosyltransferase family 2 protein [Acidobacteriaceae bacterium]|nr:glycosyltransferase family 2 protein [Acidobacteriaceae bacterium]
MSVRVTLAMPVYNGERYIEEAIRSILAQDFTDFELVITDNASTDRTEEICRGFAATDSRVRYVRNERNLGAARNYNRGFELANGEYLKWCAHDDLISPNCIGELVRALDGNPKAVLAFPKTECIDESGAPIPLLGEHQLPETVGVPPARRFMIALLQGGMMYSMFGMFRVNMLRKTLLHGPYYSSDRALLAETGLLGEFVQVPGAIFYNREHRTRSVNVNDKMARALWQNGAPTKGRAMEHWNLLCHLFAIAGRHPDAASPLLARLHLVGYAMRPLQMGRYAMEFLGLVAPGGPTQVRSFVLRLAGALRPWSKPASGSDLAK